MAGSFQLFNGVLRDKILNGPGIGALAIATAENDGGSALLLLLEQNKVNLGAIIIPFLSLKKKCAGSDRKSIDGL